MTGLIIRWVSVFIFSVTCVSFWEPAHAELAILGNRLIPSLSLSLCSKYAGRGCFVAEEITREFADGSTFTQINQSLYGHDALVVLPALLAGGDYFMEGLLKIRTAKVLGANKVIVHNPKWLSDFERKLARAAELREHSEAPSVHALSLRNSFLYSRSPSQFVAGLSSHMNLKPQFSAPAVLDRLAGSHCEVGTTLIIVSQWTVPGGNEGFFSDLKLASDVHAAALQRGCVSPHVLFIMPYLPYARGDKVDHTGTAVSARLIADLFESVHPNMVSFARLHAAQLQGFFNVPSVHVTGHKTVNATLKELGLDAIVSPDAGFQKEATRYADQLGLPVIVLNKHRDLTTGESSLKTIGNLNVKGRRVAIIDDETASGGTLAGAAEYLKAQGAEEVYAVVTHLTGNAMSAIQSPAIEHIFVTNTIDPHIPPSDKFTVLDISQEFADQIISFAGLSHEVGCAAYLGGTK